VESNPKQIGMHGVIIDKSQNLSALFGSAFGCGFCPKSQKLNQRVQKPHLL
jgi:hypothetical protein